MRDFEKCQRCGAAEGGDLRTLWHSCFYAMHEMNLPFDMTMVEGKLFPLERFKEGPLFDGGPTHKWPEFSKTSSNKDFKNGFYLLSVCKDCRGDWMAAIKDWFENIPKRESCGSGIFVRRNGANVEITREEWDRLNPGREPVVFKGSE